MGRTGASRPRPRPCIGARPTFYEKGRLEAPFPGLPAIAGTADRPADFDRAEDPAVAVPGTPCFNPAAANHPDRSIGPVGAVSPAVAVMGAAVFVPHHDGAL